MSRENWGVVRVMVPDGIAVIGRVDDDDAIGVLKRLKQREAASPAVEALYISGMDVARGL